MRKELLIDLNRLPNVLMLGNGILRLNGGGDWTALLKDIQNPSRVDISLDGIPYAMQPECLCGTDVDEVQRKAVLAIKTGKPHPILEQLLSLPFDAILTTNYTYEIEEALTGKDWSDDKERRKAFTSLDGNPKVRHNTHICNLIRTKDGKRIPVFHIHGEKARKHSLILSYYSYANSVFRLIELNRKRANTYQEYQSEGKQISCLGWLDYFLMGNVYAVGFGFDPSEFDVWWAIERKAREKAEHGKLNTYIIDNPAKNLPQDVLLPAMDVNLIRISDENGYPTSYQTILREIQGSLTKTNGNEGLSFCMGS